MTPCAKLFRLATLGLLALLAACASPAEPANMAVTVPQAGFPAPLLGAMCVRSVTGGEDTNPLWVSKVSDKDFREALTRSFQSAGLLAAPPDCRFPVDANLLGLAQPAFGIDLQVTSHVNYKVFAPSGQPLLLETVTVSYTAGFSDSAIAIIRLRLANEGSIRASITRFLERLRATNPPQAATAPPPGIPQAAARCLRPGRPAPSRAASAGPPAVAGTAHPPPQCTDQLAAR